MTIPRHPVKRLIHGISLLTLIRIIKAIINLGTVGILTRVLPKDELGIYFIMLQIANIAALFCRSGLDQGSQKFISTSIIDCPGNVPLIVKRMKFIAIMSTLVICSILSVAWLGVAHRFYQANTLFGILTVQLVIIIVLAFERLQSSVLRAIDRLFLSAIAESFVRQIVVLGVLLFIVFFKPFELSLKSFLVIWAISGLLGVFVISAAIRISLASYRHHKKQPDKMLSSRHILNTCIPMGLTSASSVVRGGADILVIGGLFGAEAAGIYGPLKRISKLFMNLLPINKILSPVVATLHAQSDLATLESTCRKATSYAAAMCIFPAIFLFVFGDWFLGVAFGSKFEKHALLLSILIVGPVIRTFFSAGGLVLQMTGRQVLSMRVSVVMCVLSIFLMGLAAEFSTIYAVAAVSSSTLVVQVLIMNYLVFKEINIRPYASIFSLKELLT